MVDVEFLGQLVGSIDSAVQKLNEAVENNDKEKIMKLKVFIFDLHRKMDLAIDDSLDRIKRGNF